MRILMVTYGYPPLIGGIEQHVRNLSVELVRRGHQVAVATLWNEGLPEFEVDQGVRVYRIRGTVHAAGRLLSSVPGRTFAPPVPDPGLVRALRKVAERERPQVVHGHNWLIRSFLPLKRWSGARLVYSLHDYELTCAKWLLIHAGAVCSGPGLAKCLGCAGQHYGALKGAATTLGNWAMALPEHKSIDMYVPVSEAVARGNGLAGSGLHYRVILNFVPDDVAERGDDTEPGLRELPDEPYLLFVGALTRLKGVDVLLRAYEELGSAPPLVLIGSAWPDTPQSVPPNVYMFKNWRQPAVMAAWRRSLVGLAPSVSPESCATVVMEAMATGRPVIASHVGGMPELVVDGETGLLVPPSDSGALARAILRLLSDPALRQDMGQAGRRRVVRFQSSTIVTQIEQLYRELV